MPTPPVPAQRPRTWTEFVRTHPLEVAALLKGAPATPNVTDGMRAIDAQAAQQPLPEVTVPARREPVPALPPTTALPLVPTGQIPPGSLMDFSPQPAAQSAPAAQGPSFFQRLGNFLPEMPEGGLFGPMSLPLGIGLLGAPSIGEGLRRGYKLYLQQQRYDALADYRQAAAGKLAREQQQEERQQQAIRRYLDSLPPDQRAAAEAAPDAYLKEAAQAQFRSDTSKALTALGKLNQDLNAGRITSTDYDALKQGLMAKAKGEADATYDERDVALPDGQVQQQFSLDGGRTWTSLGVPYQRREPGPGSVVAPILAKVARGQPLTAGEQEALNQYRRVTPMEAMVNAALAQSAGPGAQPPAATSAGTGAGQRFEVPNDMDIPGVGRVPAGAIVIYDPATQSYRRE